MAATASSSPKTVRDQVDRILATRDFADFPRSAAFLRYVVEQTLAGRGAELKESVIGLEVFGRQAGYNPKSDSIVRTQARRVRERLHEYYSGEGKDDPVRIEIPKGTYIPEFTVCAAPAVSVRRRRSRAALALTLAILATAGAVAALARRHSPPGEQLRTIAVLPFADLDAAHRFDTLGGGLTEDLERDLARVHNLRIHAHPSDELSLEQRSNYTSLGRKLGVDALIDGRILTEGGHSEIQVSLVRSSDGSLVWSDHFPVSTLPLAAVRGIEAGVTGALGVAPPPAPPHAENPQAHDLFVAGRALWATRIPAKGRQAIELFEHAIQIDPDDALAYMGLGDTYAIMAANDQMDTQTALDRGLPAVYKALALDPDLAEAHAALGMLEALGGHIQDADREYQRAIELNPSYDRAYVREGTLRFSMGDFPAAERYIRESERLNPYAMSLPLIRAELYYYWRRYDDSEQLIHTVLQADPNNSTAFELLARDYIEQNQPDRALEMARHVVALNPDIWLYQVELTAYLFCAGKKDEASRLLPRVLHPAPPDRADPLTLSGLYARMKDREKTIQNLEAAVAAKEGDLSSIPFEPGLDFIRDDPRFQAVVAKVRPQ